MNCAEARPLLEAYADGELDLPRSLLLEQHLKDCPACASALRGLRAQSKVLREAAPYHRAPDLLLARLRTQLPVAEAVPAPRRYRSQRNRLFWASALAASLALAIGINLVLLSRGRSGMLDDELVSSHVRSLQAEHLADVISTDQHTVKPWFAGKLDYSPPVRDFAAQDYALSGGRLDYVHHRNVAVLVYKHRKHVLNLYVWPAGGKSAAEAATSRDGYNLLHWTAEGMDWWAVSDMSAEGLKEFETLELNAAKDAAANAPNS
jgi:anti-sigma factor RsiW